MDLSIFANETLWAALGAIGSVGALGYLAKQNVSLKESLRFDYQWRKKEKAVELASFYSRDIMPRIIYCTSIFKISGISEKLSSIETSKIKRFNLDELKALYPNGELAKEVLSMMKETDSSVFETQRDVLCECFKKQPSELNESDRHIFLLNEFYDIANGLLNDLEYFSMCINSGVADGTIVYQSLHQTFFDTAQIFYYNIASLNTNSKDKYFTHIITLYTTWQKLHLDQSNKESKLEDNICYGYDPVSVIS